MDLDALSTQQAFASSLTAAAVGHNLAMIADQCSLLLLIFGWHPHHTQGFILTTQIAIQAIAQLPGIALVGLLLLASLPHRLGNHRQVCDSRLHELAV